jgi:hypothetical protein
VASEDEIPPAQTTAPRALSLGVIRGSRCVFAVAAVLTAAALGLSRGLPEPVW